MSWAQCLYYGCQLPLKRVLLYLALLYAVLGGFEVGSVFALWAGERNGVEWPKQMYGWITSALLIAGLLPEYWEIYKHKAVVGISIWFMIVDIAGGLFSAVSLFFREELDTTALAQYLLVVVFDSVVVILVPILNPRARRRAEREAALREEELAAGTVAGSAYADEPDDTPKSPVVIDERTHELVGTFSHVHKHLHRGEDIERDATPSSHRTAVGADDKRSDASVATRDTIDRIGGR